MSERPRILVVNQNQQNLLLLVSFLQKAGYCMTPVRNLPEFDQVLHGDLSFKLALLDISGFDLEIWGRCEVLRDEGVPFFLISSRQGLALQLASLKYGAQGVMVKPLEARGLLGIIELMLSEHESQHEPSAISHQE